MNQQTQDRIDLDAKAYIDGHHDSEVRRMCGHHYRSYSAGATAEATRYESRILELEEGLREMVKRAEQLYSMVEYPREDMSGETALIKAKQLLNPNK